MSRHDHRATNHETAHSEKDTLLGAAVEVCRGLIKEKEGCIPQKGSGQRHPLPLPRRQTGPFRTKLRRQSPRQCGHDVLEPGSTDGRFDFVVAGAGSAESHIFPDGASQEIRSLRNPRHLGPPRVGIEIGQVDATNVHGAARGGNQTKENGQQAGLATATGTSDGDHLPRLHREGDIAEGRDCPIRITDPEPLNSNGARRRIR